MSKFISNVRDKFLHWQKPAPIITPLTTSIEDITTTYPYIVLNRYEIGVDWKYIIDCLPEDLQKAKENCIRELCEAVYGDLRGNILRLERAIYEWDRDKMIEEIQKIREEIR